MSPEQLEGRKLDGRSDLFSLAVTLCHLLTGQQPRFVIVGMRQGQPFHGRTGALGAARVDRRGQEGPVPFQRSVPVGILQ